MLYADTLSIIFLCKTHRKDSVFGNHITETL